MSTTDNRTKGKSTSINRIFKRIRTFFCSFDLSQSHHDDELSGIPTIDPPSTSREIPIEILTETKKINDESTIVCRQTLVKPSLLVPREYFHDLLHYPHRNYSMLVPRRLYHSRCSYPNHRTMIYPPRPFAAEEMAYAEFRRLAMLTWTRSVQRLNAEYSSTVNALEQIKEQIERNESTPPAIKESSTIHLPNLSRSPVENVSFPPISMDFSKVKLVQPIELETFPVLSIVENEPNPSSQSDGTLNSLDLKSSTVTEVTEIVRESSPNEDEQSEEETTYTVEIIYRKMNSNRDIVIIRENTTEEQFNAIQNDENIISPISPTEEDQTKESSGTTTTSSDSSSQTDSPPLMEKNQVRSIIKQMNSLSTPSGNNTKRMLSSSRAKTSQSNRLSTKSSYQRSNKTDEEILLRWCQQQLVNYPISITNLSSSWSNGLALCALIHHFYPHAFDWNKLSSTNPRENIRFAFEKAEEYAGISSKVDRSLIPFLQTLFNKMKDQSLN